MGSSFSGLKTTEHYGPLTPEEVKAVKASWGKLAALGGEDVGVLLFQELFRLAPGTLAFFSFKNVPASELSQNQKVKSHGKKFVEAVGVAVAGLHDVRSVVPFLQNLGVRHAFFGLKEWHFKAVGDALIGTLALGVGKGFTPFVREAWVKAYAFVQGIMLEAIEELTGNMEKLASGQMSPSFSDDVSSTTYPDTGMTPESPLKDYEYQQLVTPGATPLKDYQVQGTKMNAGPQARAAVRDGSIVDNERQNPLHNGNSIQAKEQTGDFQYKGNGEFTWHGKPRKCDHISFVAEGSGLIPCWQVAKAILRNPNDTTNVSLICANQTPHVMLKRKELDQLARDHPDRFHLWYIVERVPQAGWVPIWDPRVSAQVEDQWKYSVGSLSESIIKSHIFPPADGRIAVMSGPLAMEEKVYLPNLLKFGYSDSDIFKM